MTKIQDLLDQEARLSNKGKVAERKPILTLIKLMRQSPPPACWGEDDCTTAILVRCPWRIDCGTITGDEDVRN